MSRRLIIRAEAEADIPEAMDWLNARQPGLGTEFVRRVGAATRRIMRAPLLASEVYPGVRRVMTARFKYGAFYKVADDHVAVIAVFHTSRDPAGWQSRV